MILRVIASLALLCVATPTGTSQADPVSALVLRLEQAARSGDRAAIRQLGTDERAVAELVNWFTQPTPSRVVLKERDRTPTTGGGQRLLIEAFSEYGAEGRLVTFGLEVGAAGDTARVVSASRIANVSGLYRLALNAAKQFDVRDLTLRATDLTLQMPSGIAFVAETPDGPTAVVLLGRGEMNFTPPEPAEQTQLRIFNDESSIRTRFDAAFVRVRPNDFPARFPAGALIERAVSSSDLRRATDVYEEYIGKTLQIDLADLSRERWSITPQPNDLIAEILTDKLGSLTYTRSTQEQEDVTLFDRRRRKNLSVYASADKLAKRGRFYSEDDLVDYDVISHDVDVSVSPDRFFIEGSARIKIRVRAPGLATLNLRLAESLAVRGVYSPEFGRLLHLRVIGQNSLIVSLPGALARGTELWLNVIYSGRVLPQELDREAIAIPQISQEPLDKGLIPPEPRFLYSHRAYWYPQSTVSDYSIGKLTVTVPPDFDVVGSGSASPAAPAAGVSDANQRPRRTFVFDAERPVRYLAFVISRFRPVHARRLDDVALSVTANPRQGGRARGLSSRAEEVFSFYRSLVGRAPYPAFTVAFTEREVPGGHSPPYFAVVDQVQFTGALSWRNDPVNFDSYPAFFIAHELAHQWWGQGVGWKNYHEQWISEGFAQYFALLYAEQKLSGSVAANVLRKMRDTAIDQSAQGPVYLGYRLGHIKNQTAVFRSLVYNKAAMVLHMLRRLMGDEAFFKGIRDFYAEWEFKKAGTGDFQNVMEKASGRKLGRFFDTWIFGERIPRLKFTHSVEQDHVTVRFEQQGEPADVPVTVTVTYASGKTQNEVVVVDQPTSQQRILTKGQVRSVTANNDNAALAVITR